MAYILYPTLQFTDPNFTEEVRPLSLGTITVCNAGTNDLTPVYVDADGSAEHNNPVTLNSAGFPVKNNTIYPIWLRADKFYKFIVKNNLDTILYTIDDIPGNAIYFVNSLLLNGNLDTQGYSIVTSSGNLDIPIQPQGTGSVVLYRAKLATNIDANGFNIGMDNATAITDDSGNEYVKWAKTTTAVNEFSITNAATGTNPILSATGGDTNIGLDFQAKGTGVYRFLGTADQPAEIRLFEDTDNGTNYLAIKPLANMSGNFTITGPGFNLTLPAADGVANSIYTSNGAGVGTFSSNITVPGTLTATGLTTCNASLEVKNGTTGPGQIKIFEDGDNGSNKITVSCPNLLSADYTLTLPNALPSDDLIDLSSPHIRFTDVALVCDYDGTASFKPLPERPVAMKFSSSAASVTTSSFVSAVTSPTNSELIIININGTVATDNVDVTLTFINNNAVNYSPAAWTLDYFDGSTWTRNTTDGKIAVGVGNAASEGFQCYLEYNTVLDSVSGYATWFNTSGTPINALIGCRRIDGSNATGAIDKLRLTASSGNLENAQITVKGNFSTRTNNNDWVYS